MIDQQTRAQLLAAAERHLAARQSAQAESLCRQVLGQDPGCIDALLLSAGAAHWSGELPKAEELLRECIRIGPDREVFHLNLSDVLSQRGELDEAIAVCRAAVGRWPRSADLHNNLGSFLLRKDHEQEAIGNLQRAVELSPRLAEAHYNLGRAYHKAGRLEQAMAAYQRATVLRPAMAQGHYNLGTALGSLGRFEEAEAAFRQAIALKPDYLIAVNNLGLVLMDQQRVDEAADMFTRAVHLKGDYANGWANLGTAYWRSSLVEEAVTCQRKAAELDSASARIGSSLIFTMQYDPRTTMAELAAEPARWNQRHAASLTASAAGHGNSRDPDRRLRIGYLSSDLRQHVVGRNVLPVLAHHDRGEFEVYAYYNHAVSDELTSRFKGCCDGWREVHAMSDEQVAQAIRDDQIDVLVDLNLHTHENRLLAVARRPAPVQATFAGYPGSTGLRAVDCRISDPFLDPPGQLDGPFAERVERLPHCFWCIWGVEQPPVGPLPALTEGTLTFGSLNDPAKAGTTSVALWAQVLNAVPKSRMLILSWSQRHRRRMLEQFAAAGVASERLSFVERLPRLQYLDRFNEIDIFLDSLPYNGHTTSLEAMWMGVPVVTIVGQTLVGRAGLSLLSNLGLTEMVAHTPEEYVRIASELAADLPRLVELRRSLRGRIMDSPLSDARMFARSIEAIYRSAWRRWCVQG